MTTLGKILVLLNLVFSLVMAGLIVMVYVARTNWRDGYEKLRARYDVAEANVRVYAKEVDDAKVLRDADKRELSARATTLQRELELAQKEVADKAAEYSELEKQTKQQEAQNQNLTQEINRRRQEIDTLKNVAAEQEQKMALLVNQNKKYKDESIVAELQAKSEIERNRQLLQQLQELRQELERRPASGSGVATAGFRSKPPPDDVQGTVLDVDAKAGLVTVSVGSDVGVSKDNTLEIYRLKPKPQYVGRITILDTNPHESVGRPVVPMQGGPIQKGDMVSSRIMTGRR